MREQVQGFLEEGPDVSVVKSVPSGPAAQPGLLRVQLIKAS
jgi:hypothetical protein